MPEPVADNTLYGLTASDVSILREVVSQYRNGELGRPIPIGRRVLSSKSVVLFGMLDDAAAATTALSGPPKSATLSVYRMTSTGGTSDTGFNETVYNFAPQAATTDRWTFCIREQYSSRWLIDYQACS